MSIDHFLSKLRSTPESIQFSDTMTVIEQHYHTSPCAFHNGDLANSAEQNQGSCKLLAFAQLQQLSEMETLHCFGDFYRVEVLQHPDADNHKNIRNFMATGWKGVRFDGSPLLAK